MGSIRYLGSKARLTIELSHIFGKPPKIGTSRFIDCFSGTGAVSFAAAQEGWPVTANDTLLAAGVMTAARLMSYAEVTFSTLGGYQQTINTLNLVRPKKGFFFREYSPEGKNVDGVSRNYFIPANAAKIDAIREQIREWSIAGLLSKKEHTLLLADLISAVNNIANIAGTYGCFLKEFSSVSKRPLLLESRILRKKKCDWQVLTKDAFDLRPRPQDIAYLDPPYTKRQYAAYYHILETIATEQEPQVLGVTGLPSWQGKASLFCYKSHAAQALDKLLGIIQSNRIIVSYSSDGHIPADTMNSIVTKQGKVKTHRFENFGRYAPNAESRANSVGRPLTEFIFEITR